MADIVQTFTDTHEGNIGCAPKLLMATGMVNNKIILRPDDILFFKYDSEKKLWELFTDDARHIFLKHSTTADTILEYDASFVRIHKMYIVNINHLSEINDHHCLLRSPHNDKGTLPISKIYQKILFDRFLKL